MNEVEHPENPGEFLPPKEILDFVKKGNIHPEGRTEAADDSAPYSRAVAKKEIKEAQVAGDKERAKSLGPLLGMTGAKLKEAAGMAWYYTDLPTSQGKKFLKVIKKRVSGIDSNNPKYRDFGLTVGYWINVAINNHSIEQVVTGGGLKDASPRSQALGATATDTDAPSIPPQAFAEAADGTKLDSNEWWEHAGTLLRRRNAEMAAAMMTAGNRFLSPSKQKDETAQLWAMGQMDIHRRGKRGKYHNKHQHQSLHMPRLWMLRRSKLARHSVVDGAACACAQGEGVRRCGGAASAWPRASNLNKQQTCIIAGAAMGKKPTLTQCHTYPRKVTYISHE
jgi:hypothetical protein